MRAANRRVTKLDGSKREAQKVNTITKKKSLCKRGPCQRSSNRDIRVHRCVASTATYTDRSPIIETISTCVVFTRGR